MAANATSVNELECQSLCKFQEKADTYVGLDDKKSFLVFRKDKESAMSENYYKII
jgi:hypothetical protein